MGRVGLRLDAIEPVGRHRKGCLVGRAPPDVVQHPLDGRTPRIRAPDFERVIAELAAPLAGVVDEVGDHPVVEDLIETVAVAKGGQRLLDALDAVGLLGHQRRGEGGAAVFLKEIQLEQVAGAVVLQAASPEGERRHWVIGNVVEEMPVEVAVAA